MEEHIRKLRPDVEPLVAFYYTIAFEETDCSQHFDRLNPEQIKALNLVLAAFSPKIFCWGDLAGLFPDQK